MTNSPPLLPFNRKLVNTTFRGSAIKGIEENNVLNVVFTTQTIIAGYPQVVAAFKEMKILRAKVWAYTTLSAAASGTITMITCPPELAQSKTTAEFVAAAPGAITRKVWQPLHGVYYPTEPTERDWFDIGSTHSVFVVQLFPKDLPKSDSTTPKNEVQFVWDVHVQLRGQKNGVTQHTPDCYYEQYATTSPASEEQFVKLRIDAR